MQITCPRCLAAYDVPSAAFPPDGRKLRCSSCHFVWMALPDGVAAPAPSQPTRDPYEMAAPAAEPPRAAPDLEPAPSSESETDFSAMVARATRPEETTPRPLSRADAEALARATSALGDTPAKPAKAEKPAKVKKEKAEKKPLPTWVFATGGVLVMLLVILILARVPLGKNSATLMSFYEALGFTIETPSDIFSFTGINAVRDDRAGEVVFTVTGQVTNISKRVHELPRIRVLWLTPKGTVGPYAVTEAQKPTLAPAESTHFTAQLTGVDTRAGGSVKVVFLEPGQVLPSSPPASVKKKAAADSHGNQEHAAAESDSPKATHHAAATDHAAPAEHTAPDHTAPDHAAADQGTADHAPAETADTAAHAPADHTTATPTEPDVQAHAPSHDEQVTSHEPTVQEQPAAADPHAPPAGHSH